MKKKMPLLELKKDVSSPKGYWRAGDQRLLCQWEEIFGTISKWAIDEWFIDLSKPMPPYEEKDIIIETVDEVFDKHGLRSLSYKQAAREVVMKVMAKSSFNYGYNEEKQDSLYKENQELKKRLYE